MTQRNTDHPIMPQFTQRWSPRSFEAKPISEDQLYSLFEAARWAPSSYNIQPWRFAYALRDDAYWDDFFSALVPFNQSWVRNASVIVYVISDTMVGEGEEVTPSHSHSFDAGAAWMSLALQAHDMGLITHGMTGVDFAKAAEILKLPERFRIEAAIAIGYQGDKEALPEQLQAKEVLSDRRPVRETIYNGPVG